MIAMPRMRVTLDPYAADSRAWTGAVSSIVTPSGATSRPTTTIDRPRPWPVPRQLEQLGKDQRDAKNDAPTMIEARLVTSTRVGRGAQVHQRSPQVALQHAPQDEHDRPGGEQPEDGTGGPTPVTALGDRQQDEDETGGRPIAPSTSKLLSAREPATRATSRRGRRERTPRPAEP